MTAALRTPARLLAAWETGQATHAVARGAVLLHCAGLVADLGTALDLPLDRVQAMVATLLLDDAGPAVEGVAACARCGQFLEVTGWLPGLATQADQAPEARTVATDDGMIVVRLPTTRDLLAAAAERSETAALATLRTRCLRRADGDALDPAVLSPGTLDAADAAAEDMAGAAAARLRTTCPACDDDVVVDVDSSVLLWQRICDLVPTILREVASLARWYGWSEASILTMSPARRRAYLDLAVQ